jgi:tripeptidyl-peptidase-1
MIWSSAVLLFALVHLLCVAKPLSRRWNDLAEKHAWVDIPRGWEYESPAPADFPFEMRIALKQHKIEELIASLMETSDPNHRRYVDLFFLTFPYEHHIYKSCKVW